MTFFSQNSIILSARGNALNFLIAVSRAERRLDMKREQLLLYAVTDRAWLGGETLASAVEKALKGGVTLVQLREKNMSTEELIEEAIKIKEICQKYGVPLIINDNVEAAKKSGADGVHLGQGDMPPFEARKIMGADKIIGVTAKTPEQALKAQEDGADYLGSGAVFGTATKSDAIKMEPETLRAITSAVHIPVAAIGGINAENIDRLAGCGIAGAAVVSGIFAQSDIEAASRTLLTKVKKITEN